MSIKTRFRKALKKTTVPQTGWLDVFDAVIGKLDGTISTGVPGEIYVRNILNGQPLRVHNSAVESKLNLQVEVGRRVDEPNKWQVKCERNSFAAPAGMGFIPFHFAQHVFPAADSGLFPRKQIRELSVIVADAEAFIVQIYGGVPRTASGMVLITNQQINLASYIPSVGAIYVNIEADNTGALSVHSGTAFDAVGLATAADVPIPDAGKYRVATVLLFEGMSVLLDEHIYVPFPLEPDYAGVGMGSQIDAASADTPLDEDEWGFYDVVDLVLKKITWANIKATLEAVFDLRYLALSTPGTYKQYAYEMDVVGKPMHMPTINIDGALAATTNVFRWVAREAGQMQSVLVYVDTPGSSGSTTIDVNLNGTTIYTTSGNRPSVLYSDSDKQDETTPDVIDFVKGDVFSIDLDAVATGATDLTIEPIAYGYEDIAWVTEDGEIVEETYTVEV
jgi:hypothetical protein